MKMYSVVNVENLRLYKPPLINDQGIDVQLPSIEYFLPEFLDELKEDTIIDRRTRASKRGSVDYLRFGLKGSKPSKAKCMEVGKVRELYPHLLNRISSILGSKSFPIGMIDQEFINFSQN